MGYIERRLKVRIEVTAKIILTIPEPKAEELPEEIVLTTEQVLNDLGVFTTPDHNTQVGIRVHMGTMEVHH